MGKDQEVLDAARTGNLPVIERLLSPKAKSTTRTLVASFGIKVGPNVNCQDQSGYTPLHHSALNGHEPVVRYLLQNSASANVSDLKGNFPLHLAAWSGNADIVKCLLTHGPSVARVNEQNGDKETSLHCAAQHGHTETVKVLLQNAADPLVRNIRDESPLDLASQYGRMEVVRLLLHFQPSLLSRSPECFTPLHLASRNGHKEVVEMLLVHGADINKTGENGSALHEAALFGKPDVVRLLLSRGANPHTLDPKDRTPMELVRQLDTQTSRDISQLILSRLQDGEDYEPLSSVQNDGGLSMPVSLMRTFVPGLATPESPHTYIDMHKAFLERSQTHTNVFETSTHSVASIPRVTVEEHYVAHNAAQATATADNNTQSSTGSDSLTPKGFGSWGRSSISKGIMLRRSASARSSKSLPRLPSSRSRSPSASFLVADASGSHLRQHHPSSHMFPVSPAHSKQHLDRIRRSSSSLPSSPLLSLSVPTSPSRLKERKDQAGGEKSAAPERKNFVRERLKTEDDNVFLPADASRSSGFARTRRVHSFDHYAAQSGKNASSDSGRVPESKLAYQSPAHAQSTTALLQRQSVDSEFGAPNKSPPGSRPKKPARTSKLSSILSPPPIPPKPMSMMRSPKVRPPSPENPPPREEEEDEMEVDRESLGSPDVESVIHENRVSAGSRSRRRKGELDEPTYDNIRIDFASSALPPANQRPGDLPTTGGQHLHSGSNTPMFSPPSPHTAMIEVSETLQKAVSHESLLERLAIAESSQHAKWPEMSFADESSHSVSSYHSSSDEEEEEESPPNSEKTIPSRSIPLNTDQKPSMQRSTTDQTRSALNTQQPDKGNHSDPSMHDTRVRSSPVAAEAVQNAVTQVNSSPPKPAKRMKPPVAAKPQIKSPKPDLPQRRPPVVTPPAVAPRKTVKRRSKDAQNHDEATVHNSQSFFVTGSVQVKQARIRSTRSSESHPTSPTRAQTTGFDSIDSNSRFDEDESSAVIQLDSVAAAGTQPPIEPVTLCTALSALTKTECWPLAKGVTPPVDPQETAPGGDEPPSDVARPPGFVGLSLLSRESLESSDNLVADETRSTADEWDDAVSVRTEDFEMPKEVRKFRGLIRGASYRSRSKHLYANSTATQNKSPGDSDGYGAEFDDDLPEGLASRVAPAIVRDHIPAPRGNSMTLDGLSKRQNPGNLELALDPPRYGAGAPGRKEMRRQYTPGRSDGDDSPLSSSPSSLDEFDGRLIKETSTPRLSKPRTSNKDAKIVYSDHKRSNSFYDNNNNNSANSSKSKGSPVKLESPGDRLPDLATIVDTVTAVRSRSSQGSSSDPTSGSSASSTLAKSAPAAPTGSNKEDGDVNSESDEWAQIASIMSSVGGGLNKGPVYAKEFEETFWKIMTGSELPRQVSTWLQELGLPQYETVLSGNGFDDVDFLAGDILEERDLVDMDIRDESHRRRLLESAKNLPRLHPLAPPDNPSAPSSVGQWLQSLHLQQYEAAFASKGFATMKAVRCMSEADIRPLAANRGHFKRVRASLFGRSKDEKSTSNRSTRSRAGSQAKASPPLSRSPLLDSANFFKDYSNIVKSRAATLSSTRSNNASPAFASGTVSSTSSAGSAKAPAPQEERVPQQGEAVAPAAEPQDRGRKTSKTAAPAAEETAPRSRHRHRKSSRDSGRSKPRSRSGSHSSRTRRTELSVFVEKGAKGQHARQNSSGGARPSHHRQRSHHKSSSSLRSVDSEQKENLRMSKPSNATSIPDVERAIFLASESSSGEALTLRPPNETTREVSVHAWRHQADTLITSCCNYQAYYLGSMLIHELKGVESTVEACAKMRRSTDSMKKIPTIVLAINYTGVKFIDSKSQHEIAEHEICNISFASQDSEDLATFAYITHDVRTGHHYCHVFRVTTMDMAYEIILTLGQAFEVAYQLILKDKAIQEREVR